MPFNSFNIIKLETNSNFQCLYSGIDATTTSTSTTTTNWFNNIPTFLSNSKIVKQNRLDKRWALKKHWIKMKWLDTVIVQQIISTCRRQHDRLCRIIIHWLYYKYANGKYFSISDACAVKSTSASCFNW